MTKSLYRETDELAQMIRDVGFTAISNALLLGLFDISDGAWRTYLVMLAMDYHGTNEIRHSLDKIALLRHSTVRTISRHLKELSGSGLVESVETKTRNGTYVRRLFRAIPFSEVVRVSQLKQAMQSITNGEVPKSEQWDAEFDAWWQKQGCQMEEYVAPIYPSVARQMARGITLDIAVADTVPIPEIVEGPALHRATDAQQGRQEFLSWLKRIPGAVNWAQSQHRFPELLKVGEKHGWDLARRAVEITLESGKESLPYCLAILQRWEVEGLDTIEAVTLHEDKRKADTTKHYPARTGTSRNRQPTRKPGNYLPAKEGSSGLYAQLLESPPFDDEEDEDGLG